MLGSLDPVGMPLATEVVSGERADDGFYLPIIARMRRGWHKTGLLCVGDWQRRALDTRASLARHQDGYLSPLPLPGATAEAMDAWITAGVTPSDAEAFTRRGRHR
jgi:transposase